MQARTGLRSTPMNVTNTSVFCSRRVLPVPHPQYSLHHCRSPSSQNPATNLYRILSSSGYRLQDFVAGLLGNERGGLALPSLGRQVAVVWRRSAVKFLNERIYALLDISMVIILGLILGAIQVGPAGSTRHTLCGACSTRHD